MGDLLFFFLSSVFIYPRRVLNDAAHKRRYSYSAKSRKSRCIVLNIVIFRILSCSVLMCCANLFHNSDWLSGFVDCLPEGVACTQMRSQFYSFWQLML